MRMNIWFALNENIAEILQECLGNCRLKEEISTSYSPQESWFLTKILEQQQIQAFKELSNRTNPQDLWM